MCAKLQAYPSHRWTHRATDGLIGKTPTSKNIEVISVEQGSFEEVEDALEEIINTNKHLKPAVLMSAGNTNISLSYWGINPGLIRGRSREVRNQMVVSLKEKMLNLQTKVKKLGGFIIYTSLIPRPGEQQLWTSDSATVAYSKKVMHGVFSETNNMIFKINDDEKNSTPNIKTFVTATGKAAHSSIKTGLFRSPKKIVPKTTEQNRMMKCCCKALEYAAAKYNKTETPRTA